jgi:hypothetical protein
MVGYKKLAGSSVSTLCAKGAFVMENENVTVTLTVAQWTGILNVLSTAPFNLVNQVAEAVNALQTQAGPQVEEAAKKHAPAEDAPAAAAE